MEKKLKQTLLTIASNNRDLKQRIANENWTLLYNKTSDMLSMGTAFPVNSRYVPLGDGVLVRVDSDYKIYGFAIENTKLFIKENPDFGYSLSFFVYPIRSYLKYPFYILASHTVNGFSGAMKNMRVMTSLSDHLAGKTLYA